jgi:hypothetical protein
MGVEYKIEINVPEPDARRIIADHINGWFGTSFEAKDVRVRYSDGNEELEFNGFYVWHYKEQSTKPVKKEG